VGKGFCLGDRNLYMVLRFFLFVGAFLLFVSCTDVERDSPYDPEGNNYRGGYSSSSSALTSSSSSAIAVVSCDMIYRTVAIGTQTWMAENLNCDVSGSKCYGDNPANCADYGRLYDWATTMALPSSCNSSSCSSQIGAKHRGICPMGWHIPSDAEWGALMQYVNPSCSLTGYCENAGTKLKSTSWNSCGPSGSGSIYLCDDDSYGFAALPGGLGGSDGSFRYVGNIGFWWSATETNVDYAYVRIMRDGNGVDRYDDGDIKSALFSVRCLQDDSSIPPSSSSALPSSSSAPLSSSSVATYTVTYNAGTGVTGVTVPANQTKTHDVALILSSAVPARTGYTFAGWNTSANGSGMSYASGASYTANASTTLYAQWSVDVSNCEGQTFKKVVIGTQTWMAENFNCNVIGSKCYGNDPANCTIYGRLYDWATAMALPSSCNSYSCTSQINAKHRGICPIGWHIPTQAEWNTLSSYVESSNGCSNCDAKHLKATSGWSACRPYEPNVMSYDCEDTYGFSALPGGDGFAYIGNFGDWWSSSESNSNHAYVRGMGYRYDYAYWNEEVKGNGSVGMYSVRCVMD
jgi:uncharacterized protein (TIGR02145 family)/uncharacterized repeat protein (TIGR02543 family)